MSQFWEGFTKRANVRTQAAGLLAGSVAAGGLYKAIQKGLSNPHAAGISKHLGDFVRKAESKHPMLGPTATFGAPLAGGALTSVVVSKALSALSRRHAPKISKFRQHISDITGKIRKYFKKIKEKRAS